MKKTLCGGMLLAAGLFGQAPAVNSVNNAGSYGTDIAQGSIFVVFGSNMGPAALAQAGALPLDTTLAGTSVRFTPVASGAAVSAFMVYTSSGQVAALLPSTTPVGDHNVTVTYNGATSAGFRARVAQRAYGMITLNSQGTGLAVIQNASDGNRPNQFTAPVRPGQVMVLWGTGLGPVTVPDNAVPGVQDLRGAVNIRVLVGGVEVTPVYAGRSPSLPGADQINFTIPGNAPNGCSVSLQVRVGDQLSPATSIAIAPGGRSVCEHPLFSEEALRRIDAAGTTVYGNFALTSFSFSIALTGLPIQLPPIDIKTESISGAFNRLTLANFDQVSNELAPEIGGCRVVKQRFDQSGAAVVANPAAALDAGTITLNGPNVSNKTLTNNRNYYNLLLTDPSNINIPLPGLPGGGGTPAPGIAPGTYTLAGTGGSEVGPFNAQVRISSIPMWTNKDAITAVNRSSPLPINWSGATADDVVVITGIAGTAAAGTGSNAVFEGTIFSCLARGNANSFTVPVSVLQQMPAVQGISFSGTTLNTSSIGLLTVSTSNYNAQNGRFTAPLRAGGNIDFGFFSYAFGGSKSLPYR